jgi:hypothetical protein
MGEGTTSFHFYAIARAHAVVVLDKNQKRTNRRAITQRDTIHLKVI